MLTICAVLSGQVRFYFLNQFGDFSHSVISTSTITRAMGMIDATRLQKFY
ncbi:hypothetical protein [Vibrio hepatarius]